MCLFILLTCAACKNHDNFPLQSGNYYAVGDYEPGLTPYFSLDMDNNTFALGTGSLVSFGAQGTFTIRDNTIIATSQIATFVFEIMDCNTVVLIDSGDNEFLQLPANTEFVYSEDSK